MKISLTVNRAVIVYDRYATVYLDVEGLDASLKAVFRGANAAQLARAFLRDAGVKQCEEINTRDGSERHVTL